LHWKVLLAWLDDKAKTAVVLSSTPAGPLSMVVSGGLKGGDAGVGDTGTGLVGLAGVPADEPELASLSPFTSELPTVTMPAL
jgi:hypothetical protein